MARPTGYEQKGFRITLMEEIAPCPLGTLCSDTSRPFDQPTSGRLAVKVFKVS